MIGDDAPSTGGGGQTLPRTARITSTEDIRTLFRRGKRKKTRHLDVFVSASPFVHSRFGLVVPKPRAKTSGGRRVHAAAVRRNRLKRRLREIARISLLPGLARAGLRLDVMVRARPEAYGASFEQLRAELAALEEWLCSSDF